MAREYFCCYHSYLDVMEQLNDTERGRLFTACLQYSKTGEVPELRGNERFVFPAFRSQIDRDNANYEEICRKQSENAKKRWDAKRCDRMPTYANDANTKEKEKTKTKENTPPSRGEPEKREEDVFAGLSAPLREKLRVWLDYKRERRESYKPTGLSTLVSKTAREAEKYGQQAVIDLIDQAISCGYKGIPFDRLSAYKPSWNKAQPEKTGPGELEIKAIRRMMEWGEKYAECDSFDAAGTAGRTDPL